MKIKNWLYFLYGCISGLVLASTIFFVTHYVGDLHGLAGVYSTVDVSQRQKLWTAKNTLERSSKWPSPINNDQLQDQSRHLFLIIVISSQNQAANIFNATLHSWGQLTSNWKIGLGGISSNHSWSKDGYQFMNNMLMANECDDFSSNRSISSVNLFCLLHSIYETSSSGYDWFVITPSTTYLAVNKLMNLLQKLDPQIPYYIGKLSTTCNSSRKNYIIQNCNLYCTMEHVIILSQAALEELVPQLSTCLHEGNLVDRRTSLGGSGDSTLGWCLKKTLLLTCSDSPIGSKADYSTLFISYLSNLWLQGDFVSLSHISSSKEMFAVHIHMLSLDMWAQAKQANKFALLAHKACHQLPGTNVCNIRAFNPMSFLLKCHSTFFTKPYQQNSSIKLLDLPRWETVKGNTIYNSEKIYPSRKLSNSDSEKLNFAVAKSLDYLGDAVLGLTLSHISLAYFRHSGHQLVEYILDLEMKGDETIVTWRSSLSIYPLSGIINMIIFKTNEVDEKTVEFIVPISNIQSKLRKFLKLYEDLCLISKETCGLNLVVYGKNDADHTRQYLDVMVKKYPDSRMKLIEGHGVFSRGRALDLGIRSLEDNALALFCDADMIIKREFIHNCQRNTIEGRQVYHPEFFKFYDMKYSHRFLRKYLVSLTINRRNGHWASYSYGMVCMHKSDYISAGGFDLSIEGSGDVDVAFAKSLQEQNLVHLRAPDPTILLEYHDKVCSTKLTAQQFSSCVSSRKEDIADRMELADYIFSLEEKCNVRHRNLWDS